MLSLLSYFMGILLPQLWNAGLTDMSHCTWHGFSLKPMTLFPQDLYQAALHRTYFVFSRFN